jgi:hypothetical protein
MWRYFVGAGAALLLAIAGTFLFRGGAAVQPLLPAAPAARAAVAAPEDPLPDEAPAATARTREQKRFGRYDKDRDGAITSAEYLLSRRKAFAKLDGNGDGQLSFEEWAIRTTGRFTAADKDRSGSLSAAEFATTAPKRAARPRCACKPAAAAPRDEPAGEDD